MSLRDDLKAHINGLDCDCLERFDGIVSELTSVRSRVDALRGELHAATDERDAALMKLERMRVAVNSSLETLIDTT